MKTPSPLPHRMRCLSASALRLLAITLMLLDHLWATVIPGNNWMTYVGRMAFPIFAFQISEGYFHTSDRKAYQKRLLLFALLSEIPFDLVMGGAVFFPFHQNVLFTLLLGLRAMDGLELLRQQRTMKALGRCLLRLCACGILATLGFVDYGFMGLLTILVFYVFRGFPFAWAGQLVSMILLHVVCFEGMSIPLGGFDFPTQGFAVLALLPIWLYNGEKGALYQPVRRISYLFYPLQFLILYLIARLA